MLNKDDYEIKIVNSDSVKLKGYYVKGNSTSCVVAFAGFAGNCDKLFVNIMTKCYENNIDFLFGNTRGSYEKKELKRVLPNGESEVVLAGACYEDFDETIMDMIDWIVFARNQGYESIYLVGASLSCNMIIKLLNIEKNIEPIKKVFLLCPQDIAVQVDSNMLEEAKELIGSNCNKNILSDKFFGCFDVTAQTYFNIMSRRDINNLPYLSNDGDFHLFTNVNIPMFAVLGSEDQGLYNDANAYDSMQVLKSKNNNFEFEIIDGAKHNFKHYEENIANIIIKNL